MKIIIISNRKYRSILARLTELKAYLKMLPANSGRLKSGENDREADGAADTAEAYIDGEKVCELLCISGRTLLRLCKRRQINSIRVSHRCYYPMSEVEKLFAHRSIAFDAEIRERLKCECKRLKNENDNSNYNSHGLS
jgi:hypothetical protein